VLGDSLTQGVGAAQCDRPIALCPLPTSPIGFVARLLKSVPATARQANRFNVASGMMLDSGCALNGEPSFTAVSSLSDQRSGETVIVALGSNDSIVMASTGREIDYVGVRSCYERSLHRLVESRAAIEILFTVPDVSRAPSILAAGPLARRVLIARNAINASINSIRRAGRYFVIDIDRNIADAKCYDDRLFARDGLHPNDLGYACMSRALKRPFVDVIERITLHSRKADSSTRMQGRFPAAQAES